MLFSQCSKFYLLGVVAKIVLICLLGTTTNNVMMNRSAPPPIISFLPIMQPLNPGHHELNNPDPPVLDLCVRKRPVSPTYPYDLASPKRSPIIVDPHPISRPQSESGLSDTSEVSSSGSKDINSNCTTIKVKPNRPFKAYPKDPLSIALIGTTTDILGKDSTDAYAKFREKMLSFVQANNNGTNKNMRRTQSQSPHQITDPTYWEKRKKNNEAAKRSRDARRAKEDEIAIRCAFLEQENIQLKFKIAALENEKEKLQSMLYR